MKARKTQIKT